MPAQSIPPIVLITAGVAGMGALQYGVHLIFKPTKVPSPHPHLASSPPSPPPSVGTGDTLLGPDGQADEPIACAPVLHVRAGCSRHSRQQRQRRHARRLQAGRA